MAKEEIIDAIIRFYGNRFTREDVPTLLYFYCISKGKESKLTEQFIKLAFAIGIELELYQYVINYYTREYNLNLLYSKEGKLIKVLKNEKINSKTICIHQEDCTECQPTGCQEEQN